MDEHNKKLCPEAKFECNKCGIKYKNKEQNIHLE